MPAGYYNRERAAWIPSDNGRIIKVLSISNGLANLDIDGSGNPANAAALAALNITDAERAQLATLYSPGKSLWRVPVKHFTPWDCNWPFGPPPDATPPNPPSPPKVEIKEDEPECERGSIIECQNQVLGEVVPITGTPFSLHYRSDRVPGHKAGYTVDIPLSGTTVPASLKRIELIIEVAGRQFTQNFAALPNQHYAFAWDGRDGYGNTLQGKQAATVKIGYVYDAVYREPSEFGSAFAAFPSSISIIRNLARQEVTSWQNHSRSIESANVTAHGLGGWTLNVQHRYNSVGLVLQLGNGTTRTSQAIGNSIITTFAGTIGWFPRRQWTRHPSHAWSTWRCGSR